MQPSVLRLGLVFAGIVLLGAFQSAAAQVSIFSRLVGLWNHIETGHSIDVIPTGDVWTTDGGLARASGTIQSGANFAFEGTSPKGKPWRCAYYITFLQGNNAANWRFVAGSEDARCPDGIFHRAR